MKIADAKHEEELAKKHKEKVEVEQDLQKHYEHRKRLEEEAIEKLEEKKRKQIEQEAQAGPEPQFFKWSG